MLLSVADDWRGSAVGCGGEEPVLTPHLDALAAGGARLMGARHAGSMIAAVCQPSRAMLHTGRAPFDLPADMLYGGVEPSGPATAPTLAERLREAGYHTHLVGKWHNGEAVARRGFDAGTSVFFGGMSDQFDLPVHDFGPAGETSATTMGVHSVEQFADAAERVVAAHRRGDFGDKPLFLCVNWTTPHDPTITLRLTYRTSAPSRAAARPIWKSPFTSVSANTSARYASGESPATPPAMLATSSACVLIGPPESSGWLLSRLPIRHWKMTV